MSIVKDFVDSTKHCVLNIAINPINDGWVQVVMYDVNDEIIDTFSTDANLDLDDIRDIILNDGLVVMF